MVLAMGTRYKTDIELSLPFENLTENIWFTKAFEFSLYVLLSVGLFELTFRLFIETLTSPSVMIFLSLCVLKLFP